jgi:hypothetical protein
MYHFATLFDANYLSRGLTLYRSLQRHSSTAFTLYVLALDEDVISFFAKEKYDNIVVIALDDIEKAYTGLAVAKLNRSKVEYFFTLSPFLPLYILNNYPEVDRVTSMDADLYFFDDPGLILETYNDASVLITPHDFSEELQALNVYGNYNVSFQSFKRDPTGLNCLEQWCTKCLEWCGDHYDEKNDRFADQKYLDRWQSDFKNVAVIEMPGAGRAIWNLKRYIYTLRGQKVYVNNEPLIYFHFHHLRIFNRLFAISGFELYEIGMIGKQLKAIYHPYLKELSRISSINRLSNKIVRLNSQQHKLLINKLFSLKGYWFFSNAFIFYVRPYRPAQLLMRIKNKLWQSL